MSAAAGSSRETLDVRPIDIQLQLVGQLDGSTSFAFGHQSALGAVSGPTEVRIRDELTDRATLEINHSPLNGTAGITAASFSTALHSALSSVILLHLYPRSLIQLQLLTTNHPAQAYLPPSLQSTLNKPLSHFSRRTIRPLRPHPDASMDVSEKAALINAGMMALIQAGIPCLATVCAVGVAVLPKQLAKGLRRGGKQSRSSGSMAMEEDDVSDNSLTILVDPDPTEESLAQSVHLFAFACSGHVVESEATTLDDDSDDMDLTDGTVPPPVSKTSEAKLVLADSAGKVDLAMHQECVRLARKAALTVHSRMRRSMRDQYLG
ncbi:hypothetical protein BCV69DRAFT_118522 [Microstroma glucosiphilum]|uniref:Exoribonuclease phosphorolytic domain-containing protein n=1 Tax=Pseudomicrostroma glucosiphilum TaxID=1684307 RepID=A0A316UDS0_9BASI|nr:hypothetical protein BCV69DRAFT_118522 [Pseudomicrostroma glucosiphilum]PWN23407.1 hypothetical protein BCV69DRAFT_118522 [Pseudomicrostroma glucosiphilum]